MEEVQAVDIVSFNKVWLLNELLICITIGYFYFWYYKAYDYAQDS